MLTRDIIRALKDRGYLKPSTINMLRTIALQSPKGAYFYARIIMRGPWPEGEEVIAENAKFSYYYAETILRGKRFELGEESICTSPSWFKDYWHNILNRKWPKQMNEPLKRARALWGKEPL